MLHLIVWMLMTSSITVFDFSTDPSLKNWYIVNDGVMGGISSSNVTVNEEGFGVFKGKVRLEYNGGFASARYVSRPVSVETGQFILIRLKGDGKNYQMRIKPDVRLQYSYVYTFKTTGQWEEIKIPLNEMYPSFRGRKLDLPDFNHDQISEFTLLIGNKKEEEFELVLHYLKISD